jgi:hypothetical protein
MFSSIIAVEGTRSSGYISVARTGTSNRTSEEIYPVVKGGRGHFLLPIWLAVGVFGLGCVLQLCFWSWQRDHGSRWRRLPDAEKQDGGKRLGRRLVTLCRAGALALVLAEIGIVLRVTDRTGTFSYLGPSIVIGVALYAAKLGVGFLLPEIVADELGS